MKNKTLRLFVIPSLQRVQAPEGIQTSWIPVFTGMTQDRYPVLARGACYLLVFIFGRVR